MRLTVVRRREHWHARAERERSVLCRDCAAVASSRAGELYGMQMLDQGIQDDQDNFT